MSEALAKGKLQRHPSVIALIQNIMLCIRMVRDTILSCGKLNDATTAEATDESWLSPTYFPI
jgi:hypothetical protein